MMQTEINPPNLIGDKDADRLAYIETCFVKDTGMVTRRSTIQVKRDEANACLSGPPENCDVISMLGPGADVPMTDEEKEGERHEFAWDRFKGGNPGMDFDDAYLWSELVDYVDDRIAALSPPAKTQQPRHRRY
jgi:hypothetical protein